MAIDRKEFWTTVFIETLRKNGEKGNAETASTQADVALKAFDAVQEK